MRQWQLFILNFNEVTKYEASINSLQNAVAMAAKEAELAVWQFYPCVYVHTNLQFFFLVKWLAVSSCLITEVIGGSFTSRDSGINTSLSVLGIISILESPDYGNRHANKVPISTRYLRCMYDHVLNQLIESKCKIFIKKAYINWPTCTC